MAKGEIKPGSAESEMISNLYQAALEATQGDPNLYVLKDIAVATLNGNGFRNQVATTNTLIGEQNDKKKM